MVMGIPLAQSEFRCCCAGEVEKRNTHLKALAHADMADTLSAAAKEMRVLRPRILRTNGLVGH